MGVMDFLGITPQALAAGMAALSYGENVVPTTLKALQFNAAQQDELRKEEERKAKAAASAGLLSDIFANKATYTDPTGKLLQAQSRVDSIPSTVTAYDTSGAPTSPLEDQMTTEKSQLGGSAFSGGDITTKQVENPEKAIAGRNLIVDILNTKNSLPNVADAISQIMTKHKDEIDKGLISPELLTGAFTTLYKTREGVVNRLLDLSAKMQDREEARQERKQAREDKAKEPFTLAPGAKRYKESTLVAENPKEKVEPYKIGHREKVIIGDKEVYQEYLGDGQWKEVSGIGGPRYKPTSERPERLKPTDVTASHNMALSDWKQRWMTRMIPEDQVALSNSSPESAIALMLSGKIGKSLPAADRGKALSELGSIEKEHRSMMNSILGRKGVSELPSVSPQQEPAKITRDLSAGVNYLKKATDKNDAINRANQLKAKGWTREDINQAGQLAGF